MTTEGSQDYIARIGQGITDTIDTLARWLLLPFGVVWWLIWNVVLERLTVSIVLAGFITAFGMIQAYAIGAGETTAMTAFIARTPFTYQAFFYVTVLIAMMAATGNVRMVTGALLVVLAYIGPLFMIFTEGTFGSASGLAISYVALAVSMAAIALKATWKTERINAELVTTLAITQLAKQKLADGKTTTEVRG